MHSFLRLFVPPPLPREASQACTFRRFVFKPQSSGRLHDEMELRPAHNVRLLEGLAVLQPLVHDDEVQVVERDAYVLRDVLLQLLHGVVPRSAP